MAHGVCQLLIVTGSDSLINRFVLIYPEKIEADNKPTITTVKLTFSICLGVAIQEARRKQIPTMRSL